MTRGEDLIKDANCTHGHRSAKSNTASCDLNKNCFVLELHDICHNSKCNCQKQITFSPKQFRLEGAGYDEKNIQGLLNSLVKIFKACN